MERMNPDFEVSIIEFVEYFETARRRFLLAARVHSPGNSPGTPSNALIQVFLSGVRNT
jgi:hypothetical protein